MPLDTAATRPPDAGRVGSLLRLRSDRKSEVAVAIDLRGRSLSVEELDTASSVLADELERSPRPPGLIVVRMHNCTDAMVAAFAVFRTRHALAMVHPQLPERVRSFALERLRPVGEIVQDGSGLRVVREPYGPAAALWQAPCSVSELGIALCVLTSGSTGRPRLIAAPHKQVLSAISMIDRQLRYRIGDVVAVAPPLSFDYGLYQLLLSIATGATVLLDPNLGSAQGLTRAIVRSGANVLPLVPSMLRALTSAPMTNRLDMSGVRLITTTGDLLTESDSAAARAAFPNAQVVPMYGLSECKRVAITPAEGQADRPAGAVGLPLDGTDVTIAGGGVQRLSNNTTGELVVAGPHLTLGYVGDPEATARRFAVDVRSGVRTLRTGDRMRQDKDGWLHWVGRGSDLIKTSGYRLDPAEVEMAAANSDAVIESGAYGRPDDNRGQVPVLVVRFRGGSDLEIGRRELAGVLRELLPRWAMPEIEVRGEPLPRTRNGKIDRARLSGGQATVVSTQDGEQELPRLPSPIDLKGMPTSRHLINCHTQAFMSAYDFPFTMTPAEFEVVTTTPFGVRCVPDDPHRLLVPYLDPDIGLDRGCQLLGLRVETLWHGPSEGAAALAVLDGWLRTGPVVLGPLDLGYLSYHEMAETLRGCDHYLVVLGRGGDGQFVVRDPEGFIQVDLGQDTLVRAWAASAVPEGRGAFTQRRLVLDGREGECPTSEADLLHRIAGHALDNLAAAADEQTGGSDAYRALAELAVDPTSRRALSILLPAASYRYRLASLFADRVESCGGSPGWHRLGALFDEQLAVLSGAHQELLIGGTIDAMADAVAGEQQIARYATELRKAA
jgi:acyl-CoA synthetase (AMP-forming)/AMP-acid ligase II